MDVNYHHARVEILADYSVRNFHGSGFTLIEFLVVTAIAALITVIAVPSFSDIIQDTRRSSTLNSLARTLNLARSEAIKRQQRLVVCKGNPKDGCDTAREWSEGWLLFADLDNDHSDSPDEPMIWSQPELPEGNTLSFNAFPSNNYVVYYPSGGASSNGTFTLCDDRGEEEAKALILAKTGRLRVSETKWDGSALECGE